MGAQPEQKIREGVGDATRLTQETVRWKALRRDLEERMNLEEVGNED